MGGLELKTDDDGKTWIDGIPYGVLRVQVLSPGFQTFGEDYEIKQPETQIVVRLKRPTGQYSAYGVQQKEKKKITECRRKRRLRLRMQVRMLVPIRARIKKRRPIRPRLRRNSRRPEAKPPDQKPQRS